MVLEEIFNNFYFDLDYLKNVQNKTKELISEIQNLKLQYTNLIYC